MARTAAESGAYDPHAPTAPTHAPRFSKKPRFCV